MEVHLPVLGRAPGHDLGVVRPTAKLTDELTAVIVAGWDVWLAVLRIDATPGEPCF
jgi:hypothetical protein